MATPPTAVPTEPQRSLLRTFQDHLSQGILADKMGGDSRQYSHQLLNRMFEQSDLPQKQELQQHFRLYENRHTIPDPRKASFFRQDNGSGVLFQPPELAQNIGRVFAQGNLVRQYRDNADKVDSCVDIHMFKEGHVAYNRKTKEVTVVFRGIPLDSSSPLAEVERAGELATNAELIPTGMVQSGYAQTYLSSRPDLIQILQTIRQSDPQAALKLATTGHGLGGALANMMFIDAQTGTLGKKLKEAIDDENFVNTLLAKANCYCVASPPVCDEEAVQHLKDQAPEIGDRFFRAFYENDPMLNGINTLRTLKGQKRNPLSYIPSSHSLNLGVLNEGYQDVMGWDFSAHTPDVLHEKLQRAQGVTEVERCWLPIDEHLQFSTSHTAKPTDLKPKQAAILTEQFDHEFYLALAKIMARHEAQLTTKKTSTPLIGYLSTVTNLFDKLNPLKNAANLDAFKGKLADVVKNLRDYTNNNGLKDPEDNVAKVVNICSQLYNVYSSLSGTFSDISSGLLELKIAKYELLAIAGAEAAGLALDTLERALKAVFSTIDLVLEETNFLWYNDLKGKVKEQLIKLGPRLENLTQGLLKIKEALTSFKQTLLKTHITLDRLKERVPELKSILSLFSAFATQIEWFTDKAIKLVERLSGWLKVFKQQAEQPSQVSARQAAEAQHGVDNVGAQLATNTSNLTSGWARIKKKLFAIGSEFVSGVKSDTTNHLHSAVQEAASVAYRHVDKHFGNLSKIRDSAQELGTTVQQALHGTLGGVSASASRTNQEALQAVTERNNNSVPTAHSLPELSSTLAAALR